MSSSSKSAKPVVKPAAKPVASPIKKASAGIDLSLSDSEPGKKTKVEKKVEKKIAVSLSSSSVSSSSSSSEKEKKEMVKGSGKEKKAKEDDDEEEEAPNPNKRKRATSLDETQLLMQQARDDAKAVLANENPFVNAFMHSYDAYENPLAYFTKFWSAGKSDEDRALLMALIRFDPRTPLSTLMHIPKKFSDIVAYAFNEVKKAEVAPIRVNHLEDMLTHLVQPVWLIPPELLIANRPDGEIHARFLMERTTKGASKHVALIKLDGKAQQLNVDAVASYLLELARNPADRDDWFASTILNEESAEAFWKTIDQVVAQLNEGLHVVPSHTATYTEAEANLENHKQAAVDLRAKCKKLNAATKTPDLDADDLERVKRHLEKAKKAFEAANETYSVTVRAIDTERLLPSIIDYKIFCNEWFSWANGKPDATQPVDPTDYVLVGRRSYERFISGALGILRKMKTVENLEGLKDTNSSKVSRRNQGKVKMLQEVEELSGETKAIAKLYEGTVNPRADNFRAVLDFDGTMAKQVFITLNADNGNDDDVYIVSRFPLRTYARAHIEAKRFLEKSNPKSEAYEENAKMTDKGDSDEEEKDADDDDVDADNATSEKSEKSDNPRPKKAARIDDSKHTKAIENLDLSDSGDLAVAAKKKKTAAPVPEKKKESAEAQSKKRKIEALDLSSSAESVKSLAKKAKKGEDSSEKRKKKEEEEKAAAKEKAAKEKAAEKEKVAKEKAAEREKAAKEKEKVVEKEKAAKTAEKEKIAKEKAAEKEKAAYAAAREKAIKEKEKVKAAKKKKEEEESVDAMDIDEPPKTKEDEGSSEDADTKTAHDIIMDLGLNPEEALACIEATDVPGRNSLATSIARVKSNAHFFNQPSIETTMIPSIPTLKQATDSLTFALTELQRNPAVAMAKSSPTSLPRIPSLALLRAFNIMSNVSSLVMEQCETIRARSGAIDENNASRFIDYIQSEVGQSEIANTVGSFICARKVLKTTMMSTSNLLYWANSTSKMQHEVS